MTVKTLTTLGPAHRRTQFSYSGTVERGVVLNMAGKPRIDSRVFSEALQHFAGKTVSGGFQEDHPRPGGFGEWLNHHKPGARYGSFVAAILCAEAGVRHSLKGNAVLLHFPDAADPAPAPSSPVAIDRARLAARAESYEPDIVRFLRDLIAIPAESCQEGPVVQRIRQEMEKVGFDEIRIDPMGNILGRIGSGKTVIMMDSHTDTVGVGDPKEWAWDPYQGKVEDGYIYGRGACDQRAGMASLVYAAKLIKDLDLAGDYTLWVVGSVQEEDCDGLCWLYILKEDGIRPDCVVITEPSRLRIYRGHRGRMEIEVHLRGKSCHASAPERGDNPIYKASRLVQEVEKLNERLRHDPFLGKGTIAVTEIRSLSPSLCAVPGACSIHLDRRLTAGETKESAVAEVKALPGAEGAEVEVLMYETPSYTGLRYPMEKYYPTWVLEESHPLAQASVATYRALWDRQPVVDKWTFSTNGVGSMGLMGVPSIGFGPGEEDVAHSVVERVPIRHLVEAAQFYAAFPLTYTAMVKQGNG